MIVSRTRGDIVLVSRYTYKNGSADLSGHTVSMTSHEAKCIHVSSTRNPSSRGVCSSPAVDDDDIRPCALSQEDVEGEHRWSCETYVRTIGKSPGDPSMTDPGCGSCVPMTKPAVRPNTRTV